MVNSVDKVFWTGNDVGEEFDVVGNLVTSVKPEYCEENKQHFFDKSFLEEIEISLKLALPITCSADPEVIAGVDPASFNCFLCGKQVKRERMRHTISWHLLTEDVDGLPCGTCGRKGSCNSKLDSSSRKTLFSYLGLHIF